jgi:hypothetical protein
MAEDKFWYSTWGKILRKIGIIAAGFIPVVGSVATQAVKVADEETFKSHTRRDAVDPSAPPTPSAPTVFDAPARPAQVFVTNVAGGGPPAITGATQQASVSPVLLIGGAVLAVVLLSSFRK